MLFRMPGSAAQAASWTGVNFLGGMNARHANRHEERQFAFYDLQKLWMGAGMYSSRKSNESPVKLAIPKSSYSCLT